MVTFDARPVIAAGGEPFNDIMAAVAAIRRQLRDGDVPLNAPALMVISTNLTAIHAALSDLPLVRAR